MFLIGVKVKISQELKKRRRELVKQLYFERRLSFWDVMEVFKQQGSDWSPRTIKKDLRAIRYELAESLTQTDIKELLLRRMVSHDRIVSKLWGSFDKLAKREKFFTATTHPKEIRSLELEKVIVLREINKVESSIIRDYQELGLIPKIAEILNVNHLFEGVQEGHRLALERKKKIEEAHNKLYKTVLQNVKKKKKANETEKN